MKTVVLLLLLGILGAIGWVSRIFAWLRNGLTFLLMHMDTAVRKSMRPVVLQLNKEIRNRKNVKPDKEIIPAPVAKLPEETIVGGTKTVFITELPNLNEPELLDTIELPLEDPEPPEIVEEPGRDDFDEERELPSENELRREMEEALFNDVYDYDIPDDYLGGVSLGDIETAYDAIHSGKATEETVNEKVAGILHSLNGTDLFKFIIDSEESDRKAKSIMDRYIQKHNPQNAKKEDSSFDIQNYVD